MLKEFRIHGRGGQGSVVTSELLAAAAFKSGKFSLAFPYLGGGGERRGAPVQSFVRIDDKPILQRNMVYEPDYVIIKDVSLMKTVDMTSGLKKGGKIVVNSQNADVDFGQDYSVCIVPATSIALKELGRPMVNTAILGAVAAFTGEFDLDALAAAIHDKFSAEIAKKNIRAMEAAYEFACSSMTGKQRE